MSLIPYFAVFITLSEFLAAQTVPVKVDVPAALKTGIFSQDRYLTVPAGFHPSLFASVPGARFLAVAPNGDVLVSNPGAGKVILLRPDPAGGLPRKNDFVSGLRLPHGIVFHTIDNTTYVYISESNQIDRYVYVSGDTVAHDRQVVVTGLPDSSLPELHGSYGHELKNIALDVDHKLYVSIGSTCNVCTSDTTSNPVRGAIYQYNADGTGDRLFARGLRNAEGLDLLPGARTLWAAVNNRDNIAYAAQDGTGNYGKVIQSYVDNHPPDIFTPVRDGGNYGWPFCNSNPDGPTGLDSMPFDRDLEMNGDGHVDCSTMDKVVKGIQAHSAPLAMMFLQGTAFPQAYRNGAITALHGSWNRTTPTGYKVVYFPFDPLAQTPGLQMDLVGGWLDPKTQESWGRPVGLAVDPSGSLLISDDSAGVIYKLSYSTSYSTGGVSTASGFTTLAPESLASVYGTNFPSGEATLLVKDSAEVERPAPLLYVSPTQINYEVPAGTATGTASVTLQGPNGSIALGTIQVAAVAPGLYAANRKGTGVAAATAIRRVIGSSISGDVPVYSCDANGANCTSVPVDVGVDAPVYVSLYGTGIRNRSSLNNVSVTIGDVPVPVLYAGPQGPYPGLDQVNVSLPLQLRGKGESDVLLTVDGQKANLVKLAIQ